MPTKGFALFVSLALVLALAMTVQAQQPPQQTATQFYMAYKAAFRKATTLQDTFPYMAKAKLDEIKGASPADLKMMWEMVKDMYVFSGEKVVKETPTPTGATLEVEAMDPDKKRYRATVMLVKENGAWKFAEEDWTPVKP